MVYADNQAASTPESSTASSAESPTVPTVEKMIEMHIRLGVEFKRLDDGEVLFRASPVWSLWGLDVVA